MQQEDLLTFTKIADSTEDLLTGVFDHFRKRPLAEVEFAVGPVDGFDEFLHAVTVPSTRSILR